VEVVAERRQLKDELCQRTASDGQFGRSTNSAFGKKQIKKKRQCLSVKKCYSNGNFLVKKVKV